LVVEMEICGERIEDYFHCCAIPISKNSYKKSENKTKKKKLGEPNVCLAFAAHV